MNPPKPSAVVRLDPRNPGQVLACCGLLELAHRLWPGVEGWFGSESFAFGNPDPGVGVDLAELVRRLATCTLSTLTAAERDEREDLEKRRRDLRKESKRLPTQEAQRLKELGRQARAGGLRIEAPFNLVIDWFEAGEGAVVRGTPKTWAGQQEPHKIARAAQDALSSIRDLSTLLDYGCVLRVPAEYRKGKSRDQQKVEPFYFDARRSAHALDAGFSADTQEMEVVAYPAVELLCLVGLQRFRPVVMNEKWVFNYWIWSTPMNASVAAAVFCGTISLPGRQQYRFRMRFRDGQRRYKAFGFASPLGGDT